MKSLFAALLMVGSLAYARADESAIPIFDDEASILDDVIPIFDDAIPIFDDESADPRIPIFDASGATTNARGVVVKAALR